MPLSRRQIGMALAAALLVAGCRSPSVPGPVQSQPRPVREFSLITLNIAHGRKDGRNQMLQRTAIIRRNLDDLARFLTQTAPDIAALQEADGPSFWSGNFDHVKYLAEQAQFPHRSRVTHVITMTDIPHYFGIRPVKVRLGETLGVMQKCESASCAGQSRYCSASEIFG